MKNSLSRPEPPTLNPGPFSEMEAEGDNASNAYHQGSNATTSTGDDSALAAISANIDHLFLMLMGTIILFMQAGFAFLEAGSVRAKNTINILIKNFSDLCFGKLVLFDHTVFVKLYYNHDA